MRFSFELSHVPGKSLVVADALSRAPSLESTADDHLLQDKTDAYIQTTLQSKIGNRLIIPPALCPQFLKQLHEGH